jgi:ribosome-binding protein aMBF1 (putative translation factor)
LSRGRGRQTASVALALRQQLIACGSKVVDSFAAMATKRGIPVQEWLDEEETRDPGFIASLDRMNLRKRIIATLRKMRDDAGLTQSQLAERLGVKQPVVARIGSESGTSFPDIPTLQRYANAVGWMVADVVFTRQPKTRKLRTRKPNTT